jgi:hypothetical protein
MSQKPSSSPLSCPTAADDIPSSLHCSAEWHLAQMRTNIACAVYTHAMKVSRKSDNYWCSQPQMARYFSRDPRTIAAAFDELEDAGFFERLGQEPGKAVHYRPVPHQEWGEGHPGKCLEKTACESRHDPLGTQLYAVSGGKVTHFCFPNVLKSLRKPGFTDDEIVGQFKEFLGWEQEQEIQQMYGWPGAVKRFREYLEMKWYIRQHPVPRAS